MAHNLIVPDQKNLPALDFEAQVRALVRELKNIFLEGDGLVKLDANEYLITGYTPSDGPPRGISEVAIEFGIEDDPTTIWGRKRFRHSGADTLTASVDSVRHTFDLRRRDSGRPLYERKG